MENKQQETMEFTKEEWNEFQKYKKNQKQASLSKSEPKSQPNGEKLTISTGQEQKKAQETVSDPDKGMQKPKEETVYQCDTCGTKIDQGQHECYGCGQYLDWEKAHDSEKPERVAG